MNIFILTLAITLIACKAITGVPVTEDEGAVPSFPTNIPQTDAPTIPLSPTEDNNPPEVANPEEVCLEGEVYHPENGFCYRDDGGAEVPFQMMMEEITDYGDEDVAEEDELLEEEFNLVIYTIEGNEIFDPEYEEVSEDFLDEQNDTAAHQEIWSFFSAIIPADSRNFVSKYVVFTDGKDGTLAAVEQIFDDPYMWMIEIDIADTEDIKELTFTLIHEFGHLLTLNSEQVEVDEYIFYNMEDDDAYFEAESNCGTYFTGEGCAKGSSYFYLFFDEFWTEIYDEWLDIEMIEDDDAYYDASDEFYFSHEDYFVTDYAASNPGEDIAESWAFFVTQPKPTGNTIAEKKVLFFYQFPELVELRGEIIARAYSRLIRMQS
jgi:hypothetical protein